MDLTATTTIRKPRSEIYAFWRQSANLPTFMAHLDEVRSTAGGRSRWTATAPFGKTVAWEAETDEDVPDQEIDWHSVGESEVPNRGKVFFVPAPDGVSTEVHVVMAYEVPGGALGKAVATYFGEEPSQQLDDDLRRLKQVLETGEVVRSDGAPHGKQARSEFPQHPAQPLSPQERKEVAPV
jgi:uncharacterized membrane protein